MSARASFPPATAGGAPGADGRRPSASARPAPARAGRPPEVCVFAASSRLPDPDYFEAAIDLGRALARAGFGIRYGGGSVGLMGALADGALESGGRVTGVIPRFMVELEWCRPGLTECVVTETMAERKASLVAGTVAVVALPGGLGTIEELTEVLTNKQLGLYLNPVILVDTRGYWRPLVAALDHAVAEGFVGTHHRAMWTLVGSPDAVPDAIRSIPPWPADATKSAQL